MRIWARARSIRTCRRRIRKYIYINQGKAYAYTLKWFFGGLMILFFVALSTSTRPRRRLKVLHCVLCYHTGPHTSGCVRSRSGIFWVVFIH